MTNGDAIRRKGDMDLLQMINDHFKPLSKCQFCSIGIDKNNKCNDPCADCDVAIYDWLGEEYEREKNK